MGVKQLGRADTKTLSYIYACIPSLHGTKLPLGSLSIFGNNPFKIQTFYFTVKKKKKKKEPIEPELQVPSCPGVRSNRCQYLHPQCVRVFHSVHVCGNAGYAQRMLYYLDICLAPHGVFVFTSVCMESYGLYGVMT